MRATFEGEKIRFARPVDAEVHGRAGTPLTLILNDREGHVAKVASPTALAPALNQPLSQARLEDQLGRLGGTPFRLGTLTSLLEGDVMLAVSELNRLRRDAVAELIRQRSTPRRWTLGEMRIADLGIRKDQTEEDRPPEIIAVIRELSQLEPAWRAGVRTIYAEFEDPKRYRDAVTRFRELQSSDPAKAEPEIARTPSSTIWVAPPRIFKPGEEWILKQVRSSEADGYLVRNAEHLEFFAADRRRGDFSLNVANPLTADWFVARHGLERVTASYDLNIAQLEAMLQASPAGWFDLTIHQHMPMFHMEHCVFCAFLSNGKDYRDCGRPCDRHQVALRDRVGAELPLKADAGCRNTVFNNRAQTGADYVLRLLALGARHFRVEFVNEDPGEVTRTLDRYQRLLRGEVSGADVWRELKLINQLGVTRGQMETEPQVIFRKR